MERGEFEQGSIEARPSVVYKRKSSKGLLVSTILFALIAVALGVCLAITLMQKGNDKTSNGAKSDKEAIVDSKDGSDTDSEKKILDMYMSELKNNHSYSDQEKLSLIETLVNSKAKDSSITNKLVEAYLNLAIELSKEYAGKGISIADLIAEGNLALIESINSYKQAVDLTTFKNQLTRDITNAMTKLILEQDGSSRIGNHVADRANLLDRASRELSEKLGKTPTLQELAEYVSLPEDEVQRIMQISLDAMNASLNPDQ